MKDLRNSSSTQPEEPLREPTSHSLLEKMKDKDRQPEAWKRFDRIYGRLIRTYCRRYGMQWQDLDDGAQNVTLVVFQEIAEFQPERVGSFRAWLRTIAWYTTLVYLKNKRCKPQPAGGSGALSQLNQVPAREAAEEAPSVYGELLEKLGAAYCQRYGEKSWQVCWQIVALGRAPKDVAADLDMTVGAVHSAKWRALQRLPELLKKEQGKELAAGGSDVLCQMSNAPAPEDELTAKEEAQEQAIVYRRALEELCEEYCQRYGEKSWQVCWQMVVLRRAPQDLAADLGMAPSDILAGKARVLRWLRELLRDLGEPV